MAKTGVNLADVRCELGLSELDEWMNLRLYFPQSYSCPLRDGENLDLRIEAFNSVDGSARLTILTGWYRLVCSNGLVIGESLVEIRDVHNRSLDLAKIEEAIANAAGLGTKDQSRLKRWQNCRVRESKIAEWVDGPISARWGKKAACRVFHICNSGNDMKPDPFVKGSPSMIPEWMLHSRPPGKVPGAAVMWDRLCLGWLQDEATQKSGLSGRRIYPICFRN